ncbi:hypothetical protein HK105_208876 [Polyrhizophydium stewartii]|uniref:tRNA(His) guanylyltransferase n=1 Tax=Polyrhizophydium stewartii TaxID=2732419 RepID=A0ABR4MWM7_9FUNG|nr:hypothetical protein HK105_006856 [Polyrhizophydium stewartii]
MTFPPSALAALASMYESEAAQRLKAIEGQFDMAIRPTDHFVIRIDGVAFSTFTRGVELPFDERITRAMVSTTCDLVTRFNALTGYTQSDEISLVFPAAEVPSDSPYAAMLQIRNSKKRSPKRKHETVADADLMAEDSDAPASANAVSSDAQSVQLAQTDGRVHMYNGRIQKLASVTASFAAARFNYHLSTPASQWDSLPNERVRERMLAHEAYFDSRVFALPDLRVAADSIFWRSNFDGLRNAVSHVAQSRFSRKELHGKSVRKQIDMLEAAGIDILASFSARHIFGTWVKREQFLLENAVNPKTGEPVEGPVLRTRLRTGSFNWADWTEDERTLFAASKFWPQDERAPPMDLLNEQKSNRIDQ